MASQSFWLGASTSDLDRKQPVPKGRSNLALGRFSSCPGTAHTATRKMGNPLSEDRDHQIAEIRTADEKRERRSIKNTNICRKILHGEVA
jgi:hypothetical protein